MILLVLAMLRDQLDHNTTRARPKLTEAYEGIDFMKKPANGRIAETVVCLILSLACAGATGYHAYYTWKHIKDLSSGGIENLSENQAASPEKAVEEV